MALQQFQLNGTYFGLDPQTKTLVAFPDEKTLRLFFPTGIDPKAKPLPFSSNDGLVVAAMQNAGKQINSETLQPMPGPEVFDPTKFGIDPAVWKTLTPADQAFAESTAKLVQDQYNAGQANVSINQDLLNKALQSAQNDPNITAKYGDSAKLGAQDLAFSLGQLTNNFATGQQQQQLELAKQKKDLEDQLASQGLAYSGFRKQAENLLGAQQSNIIQSTRSQLQSNLQNLGRTYERQFGSAALAALPPLSVGGETYTPAGAIAGTNTQSKQADIESKQAQIFNQEKL
jgi:hypothetical protein